MSAKKTSKNLLNDYSFLGLRLVLGFNMLWAFFDKVFGLGFSTKPEASWLNGVSPTTGFLKFGVQGPFAGLYHSLAGNPLIDWLFMLGLLGIGLAFVFGFSLRFAGFMGALLMMMMYFGLIWPEHNPIIDEHIIQAFGFLVVGTSSQMQMWSMQKSWEKMGIAKALPFLK